MARRCMAEIGEPLGTDGAPLEDEWINVGKMERKEDLNTEEQRSFHFVTLLWPYILSLC